MDGLKQSASDESTANLKFVDRFMHHVQAKVTVLVLIRIAIRIAIGITIRTTIHPDIAKSKCTHDDLFSNFKRSIDLVPPTWWPVDKAIQHGPYDLYVSH